MKSLQRHARSLVLGGILLLGMTFGFWVLWPSGLRISETWLFLMVIVTAVLAVPIVFMVKSCERKWMRLWLAIAVVALSAGVWVLLSFQDRLDRWTVKREDGRIFYIGTEFVDAETEKLYADAAPKEMMADAAWEAEEVWTARSLDQVRRGLPAMYVLCTALLTFALMALAQVGFCVAGPLRAVRSPPAPARLAPRRGGLGKIFISYSRADSEFCLRLAEDLKTAGFEAWIDKLDIPAGVEWDAEVERALRQADTLLVVLSEHSVASRNVLDEASFGIDEGDLVIPILYRPCEVPLRLRRLQRVDFTGEYDDALEEFLALLKAADTEGDRPEGIQGPSGT